MARASPYSYEQEAYRLVESIRQQMQAPSLAERRNNQLQERVAARVAGYRQGTSHKGH
jgi:hypothetical protein